MNALFLQELRHSVIHLFYPRLCEGCSKALLQQEEVLCISCSLQLPETGYHNVPGNDTEMRFAGRIPFTRATSYAYFTHEGLLQHLVHGLKYKGKKETGYYLGKKLGERMQSTDWAGSIDIIVPVPLHKAKEAKRGYNQSSLIANGIGAALGITVSEKILHRARNTETQTNKTRAERVSNMANAFRINSGAAIKGRHILLCDDVLTTGATLEACALALMEEPDVKISIATIGIAVS